MFHTKKIKWLMLVMSIGLVAILLVAGCGGGAPSPTAAPSDLQAKLDKANSDLTKAQSDLKAAQAKITEMQGQAGKAPEAQFKWKYATLVAQGSGLLQPLEVFNDLVEYYSQGRIKIDRFYGGALGNIMEIMEGIRSGTITFGWCIPYPTINKKFEATTVLGGPSSYAGIARLTQPYYGGVVAKILTDGYAEVGMKAVVYWTATSYNILTVDKPVRTPADMKGLKLRVLDSPTWIEPVKRMGALPTVLAAGEQYNAMKTKTIDGTSAGALPSIIDYKWQEVAKYVNNLGWNFGGIAAAMNPKAYNDLPDDLKKAVDKASYYSSLFAESWQPASDLKTAADLKAKGLVFLDLTKEERKAFIDLIKPEEMWEQYLKPLLGDALYNEWKSQVISVRETYG